MTNLNLIGCTLGFAMSVATYADVAVVISGGDGGTPSADSVHGWEFTVNESVTLTHLGLHDRELDGFVAEHPIGLYRLSDGTLLTSGTMNAGTVDPLIENFRYIDVPDVLLLSSETYVLSYYSASAFGDFVVIGATGESFAPQVTWLQGRHDGETGGLVLPSNGTTEDRYGTTFQFLVLDDPFLSISGSCPGPATLNVGGATPNGDVVIVRAFSQGSFIVPNSFPCAGTTLGLSANGLAEVATINADANGNASLNGDTPASACGNVFLQAIDLTTCATSNVIAL